MIEASEITAVGLFQKTHALKGELNAILDIDPDYFIEGNAAIVETDGIFVPFFISGIRPKGKTSFLIAIDGIENEQEAKTFVNKTIFAEKSRLASFLDLDEEELLDEDDLAGYSIVEAETGSVIGTVSALDTSTPNALFIVETPAGDEVFIPAVEAFITDVDDENQTIKMTLPEGLIGLNSKAESNVGDND